MGKFIGGLSRMTENISTNVAVGGQVNLESPDQDSDHTDKVEDAPDQPRSRPITLRWDSSFSSVRKITFPQSNVLFEDQVHTYFDPSLLDMLVQDCQAATFGHNGKDVLDETYRKAGKMDEDRFSTNFHPADCGILDTIAQVLLPLVGNGDSALRGVGAELYKLNVYSHPSGHFKAHVDIPKGTCRHSERHVTIRLTGRLLAECS